MFIRGLKYGGQIDFKDVDNGLSSEFSPMSVCLSVEICRPRTKEVLRKVNICYEQMIYIYELVL